jgi:Spy/CpxP family protein refolding chaperone
MPTANYFCEAQTILATRSSVAVDLSAGELKSGIDTGEQPMKTMFRKYAMRAGAVVLCSAALCAVPVMAQGGGGGGRGMMRMTSDQRVDALDKAVTLTDDQKIKIKAIYEADMKKMQDMMAAQDPDARTKMQAIRADENNQIKALLSDVQKPKFDAFLAAQPQGRRPGGAGGPGGAGAPPAAPPAQ